MRICVIIAVAIMTVCAALAPHDPVEFLPTLVPHLVPGSAGVPYEEYDDQEADRRLLESSTDAPDALWPAASMLQPATPECDELAADQR